MIDRNSKTKACTNIFVVSAFIFILNLRQHLMYALDMKTVGKIVYRREHSSVQAKVGHDENPVPSSRISKPVPALTLKNYFYEICIYRTHECDESHHSRTFTEHIHTYQLSFCRFRLIFICFILWTKHERMPRSITMEPWKKLQSHRLFVNYLVYYCSHIYQNYIKNI